MRANIAKTQHGNNNNKLINLKVDHAREYIIFAKKIRYAIRLESGRYIITGGAIKLTATMQEREHTLEELNKLNKVRDYLISLGVFDYNGFEDYNEESN